MHSVKPTNFFTDFFEVGALSEFRANAENLKESIMKPSPFDAPLEKFETDIVINDLPLQAKLDILTKGVQEEEIYKCSGAFVNLGGRHMTPEEKAQAAAGEQPLYLHLDGPNKQSLVLAIQKIEKLLDESVGPPDHKEVIFRTKAVQETKMTFQSSKNHVGQTELEHIQKRNAIFGKPSSDITQLFTKPSNHEGTVGLAHIMGQLQTSPQSEQQSVYTQESDQLSHSIQQLKQRLVSVIGDQPDSRQVQEINRLVENVQQTLESQVNHSLQPTKTQEMDLLSHARQQLQHNQTQSRQQLQTNTSQEINSLLQVVQMLQQTIQSQSVQPNASSAVQQSQQTIQSHSEQQLQLNSLQEIESLLKSTQQFQQTLLFEPIKQFGSNRPQEINQLLPVVQQLHQILQQQSVKSIQKQLTSQPLTPDLINTQEINQLKQVLQELHQVVGFQNSVLTNKNNLVNQNEFNLEGTQTQNTTLPSTSGLVQLPKQPVLLKNQLSQITIELQQLMHIMRQIHCLIRSKMLSSVSDLNQITQLTKTLPGIIKSLPSCSTTLLNEFTQVMTDLSATIKNSSKMNAPEIRQLSIVIDELHNNVLTQLNKTTNPKLSTSVSTTNTAAIQPWMRFPNVPNQGSNSSLPLNPTASPESLWRSTPENFWRSTPENFWRSTPENLWRSTPENLWRSTPENLWGSTPDSFSRQTCATAPQESLNPFPVNPLKRKFKEEINWDRNERPHEFRSPENSPAISMTYPKQERTADNTVDRCVQGNKTKRPQDEHKPAIEPLKQIVVPFIDKSLRITLIPQKSDSLYCSLAHLLLGPLNTISELTAAANSIHQQGVEYIRQNKILFVIELNKLYDLIFPNHKLDPDDVFENCCSYLSEPGHLGVFETMLAISTKFNTPIIVLYEDGQGSRTIEPFDSDSSTKRPVSVLCRLGCERFDPIDEFLPCSAQNCPSSTTTESHQILVATLMTEGNYSKQGQIDKYLIKHNIDLACIQGLQSQHRLKLLEKDMDKTKTEHYTWYSTGIHQGQATVCFLVRNKSGVVLSDFYIHSNYIATATLSFHSAHFTVIGCHLTNFNKRSKKNIPEEISKKLIQVINEVPKASKILLLGNFTAQIGLEDIKDHEISFLGPNHPHKESNENGNFLKSLVLRNQLCMVSNFVHHKFKLTCAKDKVNNSVHTCGSYIFIEKPPYWNTVPFNWQEPVFYHPLIACSVIENS